MCNLDGPQDLCGSDVHVWVVRLKASNQRLNQLFSSLSADEKQRSGEFKTEHLRNRFVISRGMLRALLGAYLGIPPCDIRFSYSSNGKPSLFSSNRVLDFNISHSGNLGVYSFARACQLGIDVEQIRDIPEIGLIARHCFSAEEAAELETVDIQRRVASFCACWTRKEAYLKATGEGLSGELRRFRVTVLPDAPAALVHVNGDDAEARLWSLYELLPDSGYIGALAFRGKRSVWISRCMEAEQLLTRSESAGELLAPLSSRTCEN